MKKKYFKRLVYLFLVGFICMNIISFFHAYKFTHFADNNIQKTKIPDKLNATEKMTTLLFGVNNPRPSNKELPQQHYETVMLQSNKKIECWFIKKDSSKGTIIIFHGYSGNKSTMLDKSNEFIKLGYNTLLVDFMGSGGSEGNQTTVGFKEAEEVKTAYEYVSKQGEKKVYLFGTSMGAVAILKAIHDYHLNPAGIIIECPFGSMYKTTCARFKKMNAPCFPMAGLLLFWGGVINNFWALGHNPTEYAKDVHCPTLLLYGNKDESVSHEEIEEIYANMQGKKSLQTFANAGHENYLIKYKAEWMLAVCHFLHKE